MKKMLVFDMDGVLAGLYQEPNWLDDLIAHNPRPYINAKPLVDMVALIKILIELKSCGWRIAVTSWLANNSNSNYDSAVRTAKLNWLKSYNFPYDEVHLIKYGTTKANATRYKAEYQILIDDNEEIRKGWNLGCAVNGAENFLPFLQSLVDKVE